MEDGGPFLFLDLPNPRKDILSGFHEGVLFAVIRVKSAEDGFRSLLIIVSSPQT